MSGHRRTGDLELRGPDRVAAPGDGRAAVLGRRPGAARRFA
nr:hypothetical protein OG409_30835 [Streptomyces sp. NBC_00974]